MAEDLKIVQGNKQVQYESLLPQIAALLSGETDQTANMANVAAALKEQFNWLWVGFYLIKNDELVLGPFQGPVACTRIMKGKGVCGKAWTDEKIIIVDDVESFPGHITCSSLSQSEIVVPLKSNHKIIGVLDVDSLSLADFDEIDAAYLQKIIELIF